MYLIKATKIIRYDDRYGADLNTYGKTDMDDIDERKVFDYWSIAFHNGISYIPLRTMRR